MHTEKIAANTDQGQLKSSSSMKPNHNGGSLASQKLQPTPNHRTLREYRLRMNIRANTIKLLLAQKRIHGDNLRPTLTS